MGGDAVGLTEAGSLQEKSCIPFLFPHSAGLNKKQ